MLDILRKRKRSWVIVFLIGIIVVVFALWGVGSYVNDPGPIHVAVINGEALTPREFELHYQRLLENYRSLFRDALTDEMIRNLNLRAAVVEELIERRLVLQEARSLNLVASDEELRREISRAPVFQIDGRFSKNRYLQALRSSRMSPAEFETEQREQMAIQKLYGIVRDSVQVSEAELKERYRLMQERLNVQFVRFAADSFLGQVQVTPEEVKGHYERNRESFKVPLKVKVEYVSYPFEHFAAKAQVSDREIAEHYERNKDTRFRQPRAVRLRHILLRAPQQPDAEQRERLRRKIQSVLEEAHSGKDFARLAKEHSEDPSAARGGEIGWFTEGQLLPALEQAAFGLKKGELSSVIESALGFHLLKVEETREEKTRSLKEVRQEIVRELKAEKGKTEAGRAIDADRAKALGGAELAALAGERGLAYRESPWFARSEAVPQVGAVEAFNKTAFSLAPKELAPAVEAPDAYYLTRGRGRQEPSVPPLERVRSDIEKRLKEGKAFDLAVERAKTLLDQLKRETDLGALARRHNLRVDETGWFSRSATELPKIGALKETRPAALPLSRYQPTAERVYTQERAAYVVALKASEEAVPEGFAKEKERLREEVLAEKRQRALVRFLEGLKAKAKVEIRPEYLG